MLNVSVLLRQCYCRSTYQTWSPRGSLDKKPRHAALLRTLEAAECDIILLQECEDYESFWRPALLARGFEGQYKQRTQASNKKKDGCAIFFRTSRLALSGWEAIEYNDLAALPLPAVPEQLVLEQPPDVMDARTRLERDCVGLLAELTLQGTDGSARSLVVGTTHLFWNPDFDDVKVAQAGLLMQRLARFLATRFTAQEGARIPVVLGGDFNSLPSSTVVEVITGPTLHVPRLSRHANSLALRDLSLICDVVHT